MLTRPVTAATLLAAALSCLPAADASANGLGRGFYNFDGFGVGIGGLYRTLDFPLDRRVPYFAARPPVYYSMPVPRTYGYSPFAYSPFELTPPAVQVVEPVMISNPHVEESSMKDKSAQGRSGRTDRKVSTTTGEVQVTQAGPLTISNPFVSPQTDEIEYH